MVKTRFLCTLIWPRSHKNRKQALDKNNSRFAMEAVIQMLEAMRQVCEFWQRTVCEHACTWLGPGKIQSIFVLTVQLNTEASCYWKKNQVCVCAGNGQFVLVRLQVPKSSTWVWDTCQHRLCEYALLQEHALCRKALIQALGHAPKIL